MVAQRAVPGGKSENSGTGGGSDAADGTSISAGHSHVSWLAECYLDGITVTGTISISVKEEGLGITPNTCL